ncbi:hypothetical protein P4562_21110 [Lysinibacillus xylanilyticus]|uniref:hypothetical protein n=1 Tax=Lysinibacillus xylanilyticus TaxID=582475 RepID=UPI002E1F37B9|nr:hypothetical protein [Lysinibacillus xylanilyticus]
MIWLIYEDFFKQNKKTTTIIKSIKWYKWLICFIPFIVSLTLFFIFISKNQWIFFVAYLSLACSSGAYLGYEIKKIKLQKFGTNREIYDKKIESLNNILLNFNITKKEQINILINQINDTITKIKVSEQIFKPFYTICTVVLIPFITLFINALIKNNEQIVTAISIFALILAFIGIGLMIKNPIEQILDSQYRNMEELKGLLEDINIQLLVADEINT